MEKYLYILCICVYVLCAHVHRHGLYVYLNYISENMNSALSYSGFFTDLLHSISLSNQDVICFIKKR